MKKHSTNPNLVEWMCEDQNGIQWNLDDKNSKNQWMKEFDLWKHNKDRPISSQCN